MPVIKIDLNEIAKKLIEEVKRIEASDMPQGQKTTAHKRAAQKALNALFFDKRRYSGSKIRNRISLNTLPTYLTRLRKALEELNLRHHLMEREAERMQKRYPLHADLFAPFLNKELSLADLRKAKLDAKAALQAERELSERLAGINFGKTYKSALILLGKEFPSWKERLLELVDEKGRGDRLTALNASFAEVDGAWADVDGLKIDHEAVVALVVTKDQKEELTRRREARLDKKQNNTILVNYPAYMRKVGLLLTQPWATNGEVTDWDFDLTTFALCAVTGRRPIEIISMSNLERIDDHRLRFTNPAKKREGVKDEGYIIYSLFPTDIVMKAFAGLRTTPRAQELAMLDDSGDLRSLETMINNRTSRYLNELARRVYRGVSEGWRMYDTRAIYARICLERWFNHDKRWERVNEDAFFSEILVHDTPESQLNYKSIKLVDFERGQPKVEKMASRLDGLGQFDHAMPELARGGSAVKLHQWVKEQLTENPNKVINQSVIAREYGANRSMIKAYLELVGQALLVPEGLAKGIDLSFLDAPITAVELVGMDAEQVMAIGEEQQDDTGPKTGPREEDELEVDPLDSELDGEQEPVVEEQAEIGTASEQDGPAHTELMPKFTFKRLGAGSWEVTLAFGERSHRYEVAGNSLMEAGAAAWVQWLNSWRDVAIKSHKAGGWTTLIAELPNGARLEVTGRGKIESLRAELIHDIDQALERYTNIEE